METAAYSFVGIFLGAMLQYILSKHLDGQKHQRDLRTQAYTDYLKAVCDTALTVQPQSNEGREVRARMANSKSRICLYGSQDTVYKAR
ncbi:hypothetical protein [Pseudomonas fluorescens]|uniref:hypothetical protein n=1 Tax=Pseudomonas fluorescens TaxID=294 RepID=UPI001241A450|nr:hypothetical protein [Pseudomonas fluorescens]